MKPRMKRLAQRRTEAAGEQRRGGRKRPGPVDRAQRELDAQLRDRALAELEPQLAGLDVMLAAARRAGVLP